MMSVYQARCSRAQEEMRRQDIDLLFISASTDLTYLIGHRTHPTERMTLFMLPDEGQPVMVAPELEAPLAQHLATFFTLHTWADGSDPYTLVRSLLPKAGRRIGVSDQMWSLHLLGLQAVLPSAVFVPASRVMALLRRVKDEAELASLRRAGAAVDAAIAAIEPAALVGRSERDVAREMSDLLVRHGHESVAFTIVASGPNSGSPHHVTGDRIIQQGDALVFDCGGTVEGYYSDITRSFFVGEPPAEYRRVYEVVRRAQQAAFQGVRPGVPCQEIDRIARRVISEAGYGESFIHRTGHGLGLDVHEEPYMVEGNTLPLQPGMVFSVEPGIYLPGRFGVRIEDAVAVTATGGERLNNAPRELR